MHGVLYGLCVATRPDPSPRPALSLMSALDALDRHDARWVLTGSWVLIAYGATFVPGDLDITPALGEANLEAIADLATDVNAIPFHDPEWSKCPPIEWHYKWQSRPATINSLDYLLVTDVGLLDIVPELCGTYEELAPDSRQLEYGGHRIRIADPRTVLDRLDGRTRPKDLVRQRQIDQIRTDIEAGATTFVGLDHLISQSTSNDISRYPTTHIRLGVHKTRDDSLP